MVMMQTTISGTSRMVRTKAIYYECNECGSRCDQDSYNPKDWLYLYNGDQLCWECLQDQSGFTKIE